MNMLLKTLNIAVVNIEMIMSEYNLSDDDKKEITMCLYYLNKGIDRIEYLEKENDGLGKHIVQIKEALSEIRNQNTECDPIIFESLPESNSQG